MEGIMMWAGITLPFLMMLPNYPGFIIFSIRPLTYHFQALMDPTQPPAALQLEEVCKIVNKTAVQHIASVAVQPLGALLLQTHSKTLFFLIFFLFLNSPVTCAKFNFHIFCTSSFYYSTVIPLEHSWMTHSRMNQPRTHPAGAIFSLPIKKFWSGPALPENAKTKE